ncbi:hypothetical protein L9F63_026236, partial [Diploptera punctata]
TRNFSWIQRNLIFFNVLVTLAITVALALDQLILESIFYNMSILHYLINEVMIFCSMTRRMQLRKAIKHDKILKIRITYMFTKRNVTLDNHK